MLPFAFFFVSTFQMGSKLPQDSRTPSTRPLTFLQAQGLTIQLKRVPFRLKAKILACFGFQTTKQISKPFLCSKYLSIKKHSSNVPAK